MVIKSTSRKYYLLMVKEFYLLAGINQKDFRENNAGGGVKSSLSK